MQAVDQVGVDRVEADAPGVFHQGGHLLERLDAVHGLLNLGVEILDAEADAVETQAGDVREARRVHRARIDLDREFTARRQREAAAQHGHQFRQLSIGEERGRAAAQVQLRHGLPQAQLQGVQVDFARQRMQVCSPSLMLLRDDLVARAVVAQRLAERDVHVQGQRHRPGGRGAALHQGFRQLVGRERFHEPVGRRIGGVARAGNVEPAQQFR
jgi:hypothetical protein